MIAHARSIRFLSSPASTLRRVGAVVAFAGLLGSGCDVGIQAISDWPNGNDADGGAGGLPCDVQKVLQTYCTSCHGNPTSGGAPVSLVTLADLTKKSYLDASSSFAQRSVARMQAMTMPPQPAAQASAADIKVLTDWIAAGTPAGTCDTTQKPDPLNAAPTCTSGTKWTGGNRESVDMHPGVACITCHKKMNGPSLYIGGTLFPTGHEPDDCNGASNDVNLADAIVEITDANKQVIQLAVSGTSGNFYLRTRGATLAMPYTAKVTLNGKVRAMATPQTNGDCNVCHTADGAQGAPGRVTIPVQ